MKVYPTNSLRNVAFVSHQGAGKTSLVEALLFNSGANVYDPGFVNGDSFDTTANPGGKDGLNFNGNVGIGPYSVVIFSQ